MTCIEQLLNKDEILELYPNKNLSRLPRSIYGAYGAGFISLVNLSTSLARAKCGRYRRSAQHHRHLNLLYSHVTGATARRNVVPARVERRLSRGDAIRSARNEAIDVRYHATGNRFGALSPVKWSARRWSTGYVKSYGMHEDAFTAFTPTITVKTSSPLSRPAITCSITICAMATAPG